MRVMVQPQAQATTSVVFHALLNLGEEVGCSWAELETITRYLPISTLPQGKGEGLAKHSPQISQLRLLNHYRLSGRKNRTTTRFFARTTHSQVSNRHRPRNPQKLLLDIRPHLLHHALPPHIC